MDFRFLGSYNNSEWKSTSLAMDDGGQGTLCSVAGVGLLFRSKKILAAFYNWIVSWRGQYDLTHLEDKEKIAD